MISILLSFAMVGGVAYGIVQLVKRQTSRTPGEGAMSIRRLFVYLLGYGLISVIACALVSLLDEAFSPGIAGSTVSFALAVLIVAIPVYGFLARWARRLLESPEESTSTGWSFYLTATSITALWTTIGALVRIGDSLLSGDGWPSRAYSIVIVWGPVWAAHWWISKGSGHAPKLRLERLVGSATGLVLAWAGLGNIIVSMLELLFQGSPLSRGTFPPGAIPLAIGGMTWAWYWSRTELHAKRSRLWEAYVLLLGSAVSLLATITSAWRLLYLIADSLVEGDDKLLENAVPVVAVFVSSGLVWWYHRQVHKDSTERTDMVRLHDYVLSGAGLSVIVGAISILIIAALQSLFGTSIVEGATELLSSSVTGLIVAVPFWWLYWSSAQQHATGSDEDLTSAVRKGYLFAVFGIGAIFAVIALIFILFAILDFFLKFSYGTPMLERLDEPLGIIVVTGAVAWYHWQIQRSDNERMPETVPIIQRTVTVVSSSLPSATWTVPGMTLETITPHDEREISEAELRDLLETNPSNDLLIVASSAGWEAIQLRDRTKD